MNTALSFDIWFQFDLKLVGDITGVCQSCGKIVLPHFW